MTAYEYALKEVGVKESETNTPNPRIIEYFRVTDIRPKTDKTPWCSAFVNWCCDYAWKKTTGSAMARSWLSWGRPTSYPQIGDIVVFSRGFNGSEGHVAFYEGRNWLWVYTLGGNQGNSVCHSKYLRIMVLGYRTFL